jgi:uncharacterized protein (DUF433 family)
VFRHASLDKITSNGSLGHEAARDAGGFSHYWATLFAVAKRKKNRRVGGMSQLERITFNPNQCGGRPCIRGMRIRVKDVLDMLAAGATEAEILESYPYLERADIRAALEYAARQVDHAVLSLAT